MASREADDIVIPQLLREVPRSAAALADRFAAFGETMVSRELAIRLGRLILFKNDLGPEIEFGTGSQEGEVVEVRLRHRSHKGTFTHEVRFSRLAGTAPDDMTAVFWHREFGHTHLPIAQHGFVRQAIKPSDVQFENFFLGMAATINPERYKSAELPTDSST